MKYVKATQKIADELKEMNEYQWNSKYYSPDHVRAKSYWECSKCGWNISYTDDCVVTHTHDFWNNNLTHMDGYTGIFHTWCRNLCQLCSQQVGDGGHPRCNAVIKEKETNERIENADNMMFKCLTEGNKK